MPPSGVAYNGDKRYMYVTNPNSNAVSIISSDPERDINTIRSELREKALEYAQRGLDLYDLLGIDLLIKTTKFFN